MSRHVASWIVVSVVVLSMVAVLPAIGYTQTDVGQFSVQWKDITVADALGALQRQFGIQYVLPSELGSRRITLSLSNATPAEALQHILSAAKLTAVNENGVWHIRDIAQVETGGRTYRPGAAAGAAVQPAPYRPAPPGVNVGGVWDLGQPQPMRQPMGTAGPPMGMGLTTGAGQETGLWYSPEDMVFRIIPLKFIDPYIIAEMFGGGIVGGQRGGDYGARGGYGRDRYDRGYDRDRYGRDRDSRDRDSRDRYDRDRYGRDRYGSDRYGGGYGGYGGYGY